MINLEHKLTVDDLIVEYMMYKVKNGYEPSFTSTEFISFLYYFETNMAVEDTLYDGVTLLNRFFDRKIKSDWNKTDFVNGTIIPEPHMDIEQKVNKKECVVTANYHLSDYDKSVINTYFMDNGLGKYDDYKGQTYKIRNIIKSYLQYQPKRMLDDTTELTEEEIKTGKYLAAEIIDQIWHSYIDEQVSNHTWPRQCNDINKYLIEKDLAKEIETKSIRKELLDLYKIISRRIAIMYHQDKDLQISSYSNGYLARANYDLLIHGCEQLMSVAFGKYRKSLQIDLSASTFQETHELDGTYDYDDNPDVKTTTKSIENETAKKLVKNIESLGK